MQESIGVLLVNLGTPSSPRPWDVFRYLIEFLTDGRVVDRPWFRRQLLVRGVIVPARYRQSAKAYDQIWTEEGSPLLVYGKQVKTLLQEALGGQFEVELAMRYQQPSIKKSLNILMEKQISQLMILPLFPHYASATTGSVHQEVMKHLQRYANIPRTTFLSHFGDHPTLLSAFSAIAQEYPIQKYDHFLFSFHGLPVNQVLKEGNLYTKQCLQTAQELIKRLELPLERTSICFQSRLGKEPWLEPYTNEKINDLARKGQKKVLVFCPSFVCDCLETTYEIGIEYAKEFKHHGGEELTLVRGLNDHPLWIKTLRELVSDAVIPKKRFPVYNIDVG